MSPTTTPIYQWSLPVGTDVMDGPDGFSDLGLAVEGTLKPIDNRVVDVEKIKTGAPWDVAIGPVGDTAARALVIRRQFGADAWVTRLTINDNVNTIVLESLKNGVLTSQLFLGSDGRLNIRSGGLVRTVPFANWASTKTITVPQGATSAQDTFNFPTARFKSPPVVLATSRTSTYFATNSATSTTQTTITVRQFESTPAPSQGTVQVNIWAVQMLPDTGPEA